jgi:serine protease Do
VTPYAQSAPQPAARSTLPDFTDLVDQVGPSVVNIRTLEKVQSNAADGSSGMDNDMLEFFKRFGIPVPQMPNQGAPKRPQRPQPGGQADEEQPRGVGSGFILTHTYLTRMGPQITWPKSRHFLWLRLARS